MPARLTSRCVVCLFALFWVAGLRPAAALPGQQPPPPKPLSPPPGPPAPGQSPPPGQPPGADQVLRVFVDCVNINCDDSFIRSEITFVNHVRDRRDADVHVLITAQDTGSGGREYSIAFIGLGRFDRIEHRLRYVSIPSDTPDAVRRGLVETIKLGLVRYVADTPLGRDLQIT